MSTGTAIITDALKAIAATSYFEEAPPESIIDGMNALNSMLETWRSKGILINTIPLEEPGDNLNEPPDSRNAIVWNLAMDMAPYFNTGQTVVTPALAANAKRSYAFVSDVYRQIIIPPKTVSSTTPVGEGNRRGVNIRVYFPRGAKLDDAQNG